MPIPEESHPVLPYSEAPLAAFLPAPLQFLFVTHSQSQPRMQLLAESGHSPTHEYQHQKGSTQPLKTLGGGAMDTQTSTVHTRELSRSQTSRYSHAMKRWPTLLECEA